MSKKREIKKEDKKILQDVMNKTFISSQQKLAYLYAVSLIQTIINAIFRRNYIDRTGKIFKFLITDYVKKLEKDNTFNYIDFALSFVNTFWNLKLTEEKCLYILNNIYKENHKTLNDLMEDLINNRLKNGQQKFIENFIKTKGEE